MVKHVMHVDGQGEPWFHTPDMTCVECDQLPLPYEVTLDADDLYDGPEMDCE